MRIRRIGPSCLPLVILSGISMLPPGSTAGPVENNRLVTE